ncbi:MAG: phosphodiester glycosidase family protein [Christensenellales bacterium]
MNRTSRAICLLLAMLFVLSLPLYIPSGAMLDSQRNRLLDEQPDAGGGLLDFLLPGALAEAALVPLPYDFSPGRAPDPARFSQEGYQDASISLKLETREEAGVVWRIAHVVLSDPSQLRTAVAGKPGSNRVALISSMAEKNNAVIAINANYMANDPVKTTFEYRMGQKVRAKYNKVKDLLITDELGDLHVFVQSRAEEVQAMLDSGRRIINAFTFGPALIKDGKLLALDPDYSYNPKGREPRMAIGQLDTLSYVLVLAEGRTQESQGATHAELAAFMEALGCRQAFNFDGGNSATMVFDGGYYQQKTLGNERAQSDMLYFATLVDPANR